MTARLLGSLDVPGTPAAPAQARGYLRAVLTGVPAAPPDPVAAPDSAEFPAVPQPDRQPDRQALEDAILLVSELVTNSVRHSASGRGGTIMVSVLEAPGGGVRVEVADQGGATLPAPRCPLDLSSGDLDDSGRGLFLIDRLSSVWGHFRQETGTTTWFVIERIRVRSRPSPRDRVGDGAVARSSG